MSKINKIKVGNNSYDIQDLSIGELNNLETDDKSNLVNAINEVLNNSKDYIKEIPKEYITEEELNGKGYSTFSGNYNDLDNKPTIPTVPTNVGAFNNDVGYLKEDELKTITGELDGLSTEDKSNLVNAINEVFGSIGTGGGSTGGAGITELSVNTDLRTMPCGIYKIADNSTGITLTIADSGTMKSPNATGGTFILWSKSYINRVFYPTYFAISLSSTASFHIYAIPVIGGVAENWYPLDTRYIDFTNQEQTISSKKTYTTLPESSVTPTTDNQLVNKKYVDALIASAGGGSGGSASIFTEIDSNKYALSNYSSGKLNKRESGLYINNTGSKSLITIGSATSSSASASLYCPDGGIILWVKGLNTAIFFTYQLVDASTVEKGGIYILSMTGSTAIKSEFVNKKYVDDAIAALRTELGS